MIVYRMALDLLKCESFFFCLLIRAGYVGHRTFLEHPSEII